MNNFVHGDNYEEIHLDLDLDNSYNSHEKSMIDLFNRLMEFVPKDNVDAVKYVEDILNFAESMVHGDDIDQFISASGSLSKYASLGLEKVMGDIHSKILEKYRRERHELEIAMQALREERSSLSMEVPLLQGKKQELEDSIASLRSEQEELQRENEERKSKAFEDLDRDVGEKKDSLNNEFADLSSKKEELEKSIKEYEAVLKKYITDFDNKKTIKRPVEVTWEKIDDHHDLYKMNSDAMKIYLRSLKEEYISKMNVSTEECETQFELHCSGLIEIINRYNNFFGNEVSLISVIEKGVNRVFSNATKNMEALRLKELTMEISLPKYRGLHDSKIVWSPVKLKDSLYDVTANTIDSYILKMQNDYLSNMGQEAVMMYCEDFYELRKLLIHFNENSSIRELIEKYLKSDCLRQSTGYLLELVEIMKRIKVPHIEEQKQSDDIIEDLNSGDLPLNVSYAIRELKYQREILKAQALKQITDNQLKTVIGLLQQYIPKDVDLSTLLADNLQISEDVERHRI